MKKITILTLLLLSMMVSAAPRNIRQARRAVSHLTNLQHAYTAVQPDGQSAFYVFNKPDGQGFVIVSADDRAYVRYAGRLLFCYQPSYKYPSYSC